MAAAKNNTGASSPKKPTASRKTTAKRSGRSSSQRKSSTRRSKATASTKNARQRRRNTIIVVSALLVIAAIFLISRYVRLHRDPAYVPDGYNSFCIDLSHHNGVITDWDDLQIHVDGKGRFVETEEEAAKSYPVTMVYVKATEGESMVDARFRSNWKALRARRYAAGAYHFYRTNVDPKKQAENYIRTVGDLRERDLAPVLDVETMHAGCTEESLNAGIRVWMETVEAHYGKRPILYINDSYAMYYIDSDILSGYRVWIAHYAVTAPIYSDWTLWQFTDQGIVDGINGPVDISVERQ